MDRYSVAEAELILEELLTRVEAGEEIIITKDGIDQVKMILYDAPQVQHAQESVPTLPSSAA